jgi:hypothetical protein
VPQLIEEGVESSLPRGTSPLWNHKIYSTENSKELKDLSTDVATITLNMGSTPSTFHSDRSALDGTGGSRFPQFGVPPSSLVNDKHSSKNTLGARQTQVKNTLKCPRNTDKHTKTHLFFGGPAPCFVRRAELLRKCELPRSNPWFVHFPAEISPENES